MQFLPRSLFPTSIQERSATRRLPGIAHGDRSVNAESELTSYIAATNHNAVAATLREAFWKIFKPGFPIWTSTDERRRPFCVGYRVLCVQPNSFWVRSHQNLYDLNVKFSIVPKGTLFSPPRLFAEPSFGQELVGRRYCKMPPYPST